MFKECRSDFSPNYNILNALWFIEIQYQQTSMPNWYAQITSLEPLYLILGGGGQSRGKPWSYLLMEMVYGEGCVTTTVYWCKLWKWLSCHCLADQWSYLLTVTVHSNGFVTHWPFVENNAIKILVLPIRSSFVKVNTHYTDFIETDWSAEQSQDKSFA